MLTKDEDMSDAMEDEKLTAEERDTVDRVRAQLAHGHSHDYGAPQRLLDIIDRLTARPATPQPPNAMMLAALKSAQRFMRNGIEMGFIRMPDEGSDDPALETPSIVDAAISAAEAAQGAQRPALTREEIQVRVTRMAESNGRVTWFVFLNREGYESAMGMGLQVYASEVEGRALYEAERFKHFLGQAPEPDLLAFDTDVRTHHPAPTAADALLSHTALGAGTEQGWMPMSEVPKNAPFWGRVGQDAIWMYWSETFNAFISSHRRMTLAEGLTFADTGLNYSDHSPEIHVPDAWMPLPAQDTPAEKRGT